MKTLPNPKLMPGFTLIELMVTIAIAAVVMALAVPSFNTAIQNNRITSHLNEFIASLNYTRSEAVKRGVPVTMCKSSNGTICVVDAGATNWSQGWIIWSDDNNNSIYNAGVDTILKVYGPAFINILISSSHATYRNSVTYSSDGSIPTTSGTINICDDRPELVGKNIVLSPAGRARIDAGIQC